MTSSELRRRNVKSKKQPEREVEEYLVKQVEKLGGLCWKFTSPGTIGVPDRVVIFNGQTHFVETKKPGEKPRRIQQYRLTQINDQLVPACYLDTKEKVDDFIQTLRLPAGSL